MGNRIPLIGHTGCRQHLLASIVLIVSFETASSQQVCQLIPDPDAPGWQTLSCRPDVEISPSEDAIFSFADADGDGQIDTLDLDAGAIRTRVEAADDPTLFEIRTQQAIVSVRGTDWATALTDTGTEVFVVSGEVQVMDLALTGGVVLTEGQGVDVPDIEPESGGASRVDEAQPPAARAGAPSDTAPEPAFLQPTRWGTTRADNLLARFPGT